MLRIRRSTNDRVVFALSGRMAEDDIAELQALIGCALHEAGWNKSKTARRLGITRTQLYGRLRKYGLEAVRTP